MIYAVPPVPALEHPLLPRTLGRAPHLVGHVGAVGGPVAPLGEGDAQGGAGAVELPGGEEYKIYIFFKAICPKIGAKKVKMNFVRLF